MYIKGLALACSGCFLTRDLALWESRTPLVLLVEGLAFAARQRRPDLLLVLIREGLAPGAVAAPDLAPQGLQKGRLRAAPIPLLTHRASLERTVLHRQAPAIGLCV